MSWRPRCYFQKMTSLIFSPLGHLGPQKRINMWLHTLLLSSHRPPFLARKFKCVPKPLLLLQAYLLGCSFNSFDKSWNARSYIVILIGVAWILPLFVISQRYCCIIYSVRNNIFVTANASAEEERARKVMQHNTYISLDFPVWLCLF